VSPFRNPFSMKKPASTFPKCSSCGSDIRPSPSSIEQDILRGGGSVTGGTGLGETLYQGVICKSCRRTYCLDCFETIKVTKQGQCAECGVSLSPLFADYLR
jgi:hypothetical protein